MHPAHHHKGCEVLLLLPYLCRVWFLHWKQHNQLLQCLVGRLWILLLASSARTIKVENDSLHGRSRVDAAASHDAALQCARRLAWWCHKGVWGQNCEMFQEISDQQSDNPPACVPAYILYQRSDVQLAHLEQ